eukprot:CAMPEP_0119565120 /NCGR_PEP_ID=MMETSP1352-20130426/29072_1 /TAXON_ID=265584 /ORGANISM="Stauroneis constricta, Strain CCMP1120" /LENGTH=803 /DNA_ID=CAMNT_0007613977 /DNA_START=33 /DNA_END=2441 /DNA_ORIENTATION=-
MNVQRRNDVAIYSLSSGPVLPEWLGDRARRNISKRDEQVRRRIELIQDFQMPSSSSKIVTSADGRYVIVAGTYSPRYRCYDLHDLTMKFERCLDADVIDMVMLGEDYGKIALLQNNRYISFQAHYGVHESVRVPRFGRAMAYEPTTCEILVAAQGNGVYRLNLEEGRFSEPWSFDSSSDDVGGVSIAVAPSHPLACVGCQDGIARFWDNRSPDTLLKPFLKLDVASATEGYGYADDTWGRNIKELTSIAFDSSGMHMAAGTAGGLAVLYDIRSSKPLHVHEHKLGMPIHTMRFHSGSGCVFSSDEKLVKAWRYKSTGDLVQISDTRFGSISDDDKASREIGAVVANIEGSGKFTNFVIAGDEKDPTGNSSGLLLCTTDQPKLDSFYIPKIGLAPKWCSFLENITEELEERDLKRDDGTTSDLVQDGQEAVFENYKFVSRDELEKMGVSDLIGTPLLRGYMHGFFMDINLYNRVRAVANPFEYEQYRKKKLKQRLEDKRASRIAPKASNGNNNKKTAVNPTLAERLQDKVGTSKTTKAGKAAGQLLSDNRFGGLFTNPDFEIDEEDEDFKLRNPSGVAAAKNKRRRDDMDSEDEDDDSEDGAVDGNDQNDSEDDRYAGFQRINARDESDEDDGASASDSDSDDDGFRGGKVRGEAYDQIKAMREQSKKGSAKKPAKEKKQQNSNNKKKKRTAVMYEADDLGDANDAAVIHSGLGHVSAAKEVKNKISRMHMSLADRAKLKAQEKSNIVSVRQIGGTKEIQYIPKDQMKKNQDADRSSHDGDDDNKSKRGKGRRNRRGVKDLRLK